MGKEDLMKYACILAFKIEEKCEIPPDFILHSE
jgi:hypothetical protein